MTQNKKNNVYHKVPVETLKNFIINKLDELGGDHIGKVYEAVSGNTCLHISTENTIDILVNKTATHPCDPRFGPPFPPTPQEHPDDQV